MKRCLCVAGALALIGAAAAQDWPAWGGADPGRNMYAATRGLPKVFHPGQPKAGSEETDPATTTNLLWEIALGSQTYGNPVVAGGRVYVGTNNDNPRDERHKGDRSILLCLDEKTGRLLWQLVVPKLKAGKAMDWESLGILASPCVVGNRLYLVTSRCEVLCLDTEGMANGNDGPFTDEANYVVMETGLAPIPPGPHDADILWRYDMLDELGVFPHNAANGSVLVMGNLVYAPTSNGTDWSQSNVPSPFSPSLIALDARSGLLAAVDDAAIGPRIFHGQWSSPSGGIVDGRPLVFFGGGDGWLYAFDAQPSNVKGTNVLKVVWRADVNPREYRFADGRPIKYGAAEGPSEINATPVFFEDRVYVAIGQDPEQGEGVGRLACYTARRTGEVSVQGLVWDFRQIHRSISTVAIDPASGLLFAADFSGFVYCLDARTGQLHWTHDLKAHVWGSPLVADGRVYIGDEDGDLCVFEVNKTRKVLAQVTFQGPIYSTPVAANSTLYIATPSRLYAFKEAARQP